MSDVKKYAKQIKKADWDDLVEILIELEMQRHILLPHLTRKQISEYDKLINVCEVKKQKLISKQAKTSDFSRFVQNKEYDIAEDWEDDYDLY